MATTNTSHDAPARAFGNSYLLKDENQHRPKFARSLCTHLLSKWKFCRMYIKAARFKWFLNHFESRTRCLGEVAPPKSWFVLHKISKKHFLKSILNSFPISKKKNREHLETAFSAYYRVHSISYVSVRERSCRQQRNEGAIHNQASHLHSRVATKMRICNHKLCKGLQSPSQL